MKCRSSFAAGSARSPLSDQEPGSGMRCPPRRETSESMGVRGQARALGVADHLKRGRRSREADVQLVMGHRGSPATGGGSSPFPLGTSTSTSSRAKSPLPSPVPGAQSDPPPWGPRCPPPCSAGPVVRLQVVAQAHGLRKAATSGSLLPGQVWTGGAHGEGRSPQSPSWRLCPGKSTPSSPRYSEWSLMGRKRLERKALTFAGRPRFAREKWLPPTSPLPAAPRAGL